MHFELINRMFRWDILIEWISKLHKLHGGILLFDYRCDLLPIILSSRLLFSGRSIVLYQLFRGILFKQLRSVKLLKLYRWKIFSGGSIFLYYLFSGVFSEL